MGAPQVVDLGGREDFGLGEALEGHGVGAKPVRVVCLGHVGEEGVLARWFFGLWPLVEHGR